MQKENIYCGSLMVDHRITFAVSLNYRFLAEKLRDELGNRLNKKQPRWSCNSCVVDKAKDYHCKYYITHPPGIPEDIILETLREIEDDVAAAIEAERLRKLLEQ